MQTRSQVSAVLAAIALAAGLADPAPAQYALADGPVFSAEEMTRGIAMSGADCAHYRSTVFVHAQGQGVCFRYYLSTAGGSGPEAVYYLGGDRDAATFAFDPAVLARAAGAMSNQYRRPAVYLGRMGMEGSSGSHRFRRTYFEVEATSRAMDAINARHGFRLVHVMGQSGGGHLTGSLLGLRGDIGCAAPGSGRLAFDADYARGQLRRPPALRHYDPAAGVPAAARLSTRARVLVVTDPHDQRVPAHMQTGFVDLVRRAGGRISQFFIAASDDLAHGATPFVRQAIAGCLAGAADAEIQATLARLGDFLAERRVAQAEGRQPETNYAAVVRPIRVPPPAGVQPPTESRGLSAPPPPPPPASSMRQAARSFAPPARPAF